MKPPVRRHNPRRRRPTKQKKAPKSLQQSISELFDLKKSKDRKKDPDIRTKAANRLVFMGGLFTVIFLVLAFRAGQLMLLPDERLERQSQRQFEKSEEIKGRRGNILDRNQEILATSVMLWNLVLNPAEIREQDIPEISHAIGDLFDVDGDKLGKRLQAKKRTQWMLVRRKNRQTPVRLDPADIDRLNKRLKELRRSHDAKNDTGFRRSLHAIDYQETQYRYYPNRDDAAALLGLTNLEGVGESGVEQMYDDILHGEKFRVITLRDRQNNDIYHPLREQSLPKAQDGHSILLSIDRRIQHATDNAIKTAIETTGAKAGFAIVMDVTTGEILATSNQPTINLNDRRVVNFEYLYNNAMLTAYEPGSVFKPFIAAMAMEEKKYGPSSLIDCENGYWRFPGGVVKDDHGKGLITLTEVIQHSTNVGVAKIALELGSDTVIEYLKGFGFGEYPTLRFPASPSGKVRSPDSIKPIELATTSYGYGISATMLQLTSAFATIGNGGVRMKPILLKERLGTNMEVIEQTEIEELEQVISAKTAKDLVQMMEKVVTDGTAPKAKVDGYRVAGKTGTALKHLKNGGYSETERIGSFIGLIPADNPKVVISISIDTPTIGKPYGGVVAAPAFSEIALATMRSLGIPPDPSLIPKEPQQKDPPVENKNQQNAEDEPTLAIQTKPQLQRRPKNKFSMVDLQGLSYRDVLVVLSAANLNIQVTGNGRVTNQIPPPGSLISSGDQVEVILQ